MIFFLIKWEINYKQSNAHVQPIDIVKIPLATQPVFMALSAVNIVALFYNATSVIISSFTVLCKFEISLIESWYSSFILPIEAKYVKPLSDQGIKHTYEC